MSKRTGPERVKLSDFKERKGTEGAVDVELDDGTVVRFPPPELWPDEFTRVRKDMTPEEQAQAILGDKFAVFISGGGTIMLALAIVGEFHGANAGE